MIQQIFHWPFSLVSLYYQVTSATTMGSVKSAGLSFLLLSFLLYIADSYPNMDLPNSKTSAFTYLYSQSMCTLCFQSQISDVTGTVSQAVQWSIVSSFSSGLRGVHTEKEQCFLQGSSGLPVHGLLLLQSVPDSSQGHEDNDDPKEHHLGGNVLCRQA